MIAKCLMKIASFVTAVSITLAVPSGAWAQPHHADADDAPTKTPIKHLVVIFQENISFDHYFGTYPYATNPPGEPPFHAKDDTPRVNNLLTSGLLHDNPNSTQPFRLDRTQAWTCDEDHGYASEQKAFDRGLMDKFPEDTGEGHATSTVPPFCNFVTVPTLQNTVMGYYDGNTVTAIWNYAQHFAMSDNSYGTSFGPSTPGALNLIAGNTNLGTVMNSSRGQASGSTVGDLAGGGSTGNVIGDARPAFDDCAPTGKTYIQASGTGTGPGHDNIGDLLIAKNLTWGWFAGGFTPSSVLGGIATCATSSVGVAGGVTTAQQDYVSHHTPLLYYATVGGKPTNVHHLPYTGVIGEYDQANHQYDLNDFWTALKSDQLPAVSFLKFKAINDGHPGNSDPLDEQSYLTYTINKLEQSEEWGEIAVVVLYDDSDGWYDHQMNPVIHQSESVGDDFLTDTGKCGAYPPPNPGPSPAERSLQSWSSAALDGHLTLG